METHRYTTPQNMEEALRREQDLKVKIHDIEEQLSGTNTLNKPQPDWRSRASAAISLARRDLERIQSWIKEHQPSPEAVENMKKQEATDLLWSSFQLLTTLRRTGTSFTVEQLDLVRRLGEFFKVSKENALKTARSCRQGGIEEVAENGALIVEVTRDPKDLGVLERNWKDSRQGKGSQLGPDGQLPRVVQAAFALVRGYLALNQIKEAVETAKTMHANDVKVVLTWIKIYDVTKDPQHLEEARKAAGTMTVDAEVYARCVIFEKSGALSDLKKSQETLEKSAEVLEGGRLTRMKGLLYKAYLTWGLFSEADTLLRSYAKEGQHLFDLCHLVEAQPTLTNLQLLLQQISLRPVSRSVVLQKVLNACIATGQLDTARAVASSCENFNGLQCQGFARLAKEIKNPNRHEDLQKAEELSVSMSSASSTTRSLAQLYLVEALILAGRIDDAAQLASVISNPPDRCKACLLVHTTTSSSAS